MRCEVALLLPGLLLTRLLGFYFSTVTTFSIVENVHRIIHFPHARHRVSCIHYAIMPSHASHVPFALNYFIVALSTTYDNYVIRTLLYFLVVVILLPSEHGDISSIYMHEHDWQLKVAFAL